MTEENKQLEPQQPQQPQQIEPQQPQQEPQQQQDAFDTILAQKDAQIAALIEQTNSLTQQITQMVQGGVQFTNQPAQPQQPQAVNPMQQFNPPALSDDDDFSLEALGREIGKPRKG